MAAAWTIYGIHSSDAASTAASWRHTLLADSALAFGGGTRASAILTAIQKDDYNTSVHIANSATQGSAYDTCPSPHLHVLTKCVNTVTGCYADTVPQATYITIADGSPAPAKGIMFRFTYDSAIEITNAEIWAGTGAQVDVFNHENCQIWMVELNTSVGLTWVRPYYGSTLALTEKSGKQPNSNTQHDWYVGMSLKASAVGYEADNKFKITCTYQ